jgi:hypothetical protein
MNALWVWCEAHCAWSDVISVHASHLPHGDGSWMAQVRKANVTALQHQAWILWSS